MAISDCLASAAALFLSLPERQSTFALGSFAWMVFNGEVGNQTCACHSWVGPGGSTWAEPPPEIMPKSARSPMIAFDLIEDLSRGRTLLAFFSRTMLPSSIFCAV